MITQNVCMAIKKYNMFNENDIALVGFSGGADSTALLLTLFELQNTLNIKVKAIHINHQLRGDESDMDERFCEELCREHSIPFTCIHIDVNTFAQKNGKSIEESARILRYNSFEKVASEEKFPCKICTAHNLNDNAETIIFNMARGTGLKGLCGIPFKRDNIVRPLLTSTREDVENYLNRKGQAFVTDSTNLSDDYTRNKIRHNVVPVLTEINSGFLNCIRNMTDILYDDEEFLDITAQGFINDDLREVHPAVRKRVIMKILKPYGFDVSSYMILRIESAIKSDSLAKLNVHKNCYVYVKNGKVKVQMLSDDDSFSRKIFQPVLTKIGENCFFGDKKVMIFVNNSEIIKEYGNIHINLTKDYLDYDTIQGDILLRNRRDGDGYVRCGRDFRSSLKKLFNADIPEHERDYIAILEDDIGIIWVEGFGISDRVKITDKTQNIMTIEIT